MKTFTATIAPEGSQIPEGYESPKAKSHTFESPDWDCASAYCDAMDWRLEGELLETVGADDSADESWKEQKSKAAAAKPKAPEYKPVYGNKPLSAGQKSTLCQLFKSAFDHMDKYGLIEGIDDAQCQSRRLADWRHMIVKQVTGRKGLTTCQNSHYRKLEAELLKLGGQKYKNPKAFQTGHQSKQAQDTMENREQALHLIGTAIKEHAKAMSAEDLAPVVNEAYLLSIARTQNKKAKLDDYASLITLTAHTLTKLLYTARNRMASAEGRGKTKDRNKNQRKKP